MYAFVATFFRQDGPGVLARMAPRVAAAMPTTDVELSFKGRWLQELDGGWLLVGPKQPEERPRITEAVTPDLGALVVGTTTTSAPPAEAVLASYRVGGLSAVRELEGNFSAIGQIAVNESCS